MTKKNTFKSKRFTEKRNAWQIDGDLVETIFTTVIMCVYKCMNIDLSVMRKFTEGGRSDGNLLNGNFRDK